MIDLPVDVSRLLTKICAFLPLCNKCSAVAEMGDRLATIDLGQKLGAVPLMGEAGSPCNTIFPGPRAIFVLSGILYPAVFHNRHGPKIGGLCPLGGGAGCTWNTMLPGPRPTLVPSGILVHPAVWPQLTWPKRGLCLFGGEGAGSPSNIMWPAPKPTSIPSGILIHLHVWPQQTWAKNRRLCPLFGGIEIYL